MIVTPLPGTPAFVAIAKGWSLLLVGSFGVASIMSPRQAFFPRALTAVGMSFAVGFALVVFASRRPETVERAVRAEYTRRVDSWLADWESVSKTREWQEITRDNPGMDSLAR
jgi:hypothetical protein